MARVTREVWQGLRGRCGKGYEGGVTSVRRSVARVTREVWQGLRGGVARVMGGVARVMKEVGQGL